MFGPFYLTQKSIKWLIIIWRMYEGYITAFVIIHLKSYTPAHIHVHPSSESILAIIICAIVKA